ncbi:YfcC family protein [Pseudoflavonifractor sp. 60]|uniref:YfcC family protein n=1 Tax=Pseudoflavonifractor sp. 60 TaxID=2304576 RepID=UPI001367C1CC|nr:YfcC family protein [Pseudoflavonifractor sp. 60]NBI67911.1 YfcC family protein [Pseudoflavonifractor sp. 60]
MKEKKQFKIPYTYTVLFIMMILAAIMTWIIPAGEYDTEKVGNVTRVIAGTYHAVAATPQGPWAMLMAVVQGCYQAAKLMFMVMFCGAAMEVLQQSGAISAAFGKVSSNKRVNGKILIMMVFIFVSIGAAAGVFVNSTLAMIPVGVLIAQSLGYDAFTGFLMVGMASYCGTSVGWATPHTIGIAQTIAELPMFSGFGVRVLLHIINFLITYYFIARYINLIEKDPTRSLNYEVGMERSEYMGIKSNFGNGTESGMTWQHTVSMLALVVAIIAVMIGTIKFGWGQDEMSTTFFVLALFVGLISGMGLDGTFKAFISGCAKMASAAFIVGFANGISIILTNGNILNTIVNWLSIPMSKMSAVMAANFMFVVNTIINFFIPSGSGQATAVMPLMVPIADLCGITRQVAVQAFQFGDGFSNALYPVGSTLAALSAGKTEYSRYVKWAIPMLLCQAVLSIVTLTILQSIGWTGL